MLDNNMNNNQKKMLLVLLFINFINTTYSKNLPDSTGRSFVQILGFELEKIYLKDILVKLGNTVQYNSGDAALSSTRIHYYIIKDSTYITFNSGEMGGGERVTSFYISKHPPKEKYHVNSQETFSLYDLGGIRIGFKKDKFLSYFPVKNRFEKSEIDYYRMGFENKKKPDIFIHYENKIIMNKEEINYFNIKDISDAFFDETITIIPQFLNDKLFSLKINKVTSY
jgi:hypothetical protein